MFAYFSFKLFVGHSKPRSFLSFAQQTATKPGRLHPSSLDLRSAFNILDEALTRLEPNISRQELIEEDATASLSQLRSMGIWPGPLAMERRTHLNGVL